MRIRIQEANPMRIHLGMHRISGRIIRPFLRSGIRPDTGFDGQISGRILDTSNSRISGKSMKCYLDNLLFFIKILQLFFCQQNLPPFKVRKIHKSGLMKLPACQTFSDNLYVEPDIRQDIRQEILPDIRYRYPALPDIRYPALPDIRYPAFKSAGYPAKSVYGASLDPMRICIGNTGINKIFNVYRKLLLY
jgi:hypothetical protein